MTLPAQKLVVILNGPNMNMLGLRQPHLYGRATIDDVEALCAETAERLGLSIDFRQTNSEGEIVSWVQRTVTGVQVGVGELKAGLHSLDSKIDGVGKQIDLVVKHLLDKEA